MTLGGHNETGCHVKVKAWLYLMRNKRLEKKIGDTLPIDETGQVCRPDSLGSSDMKTIESREGPFIEVVAGSVSFPKNLTPPNLEFWNSRYK
jgi:hypothetical protein